MGHSRLGVLPATRRWQEVVAAISGGSSAFEVANATMDATEKALEALNGDPALVRSFWLLTQIPLAAKEPDFGAALRAVGIQVVGANPSLAEVTAGFVQAVDAVVDGGKGRTDLGELAELAAAEALAGAARTNEIPLFGPRADAVQIALAPYATETQFGHLARDFFARFMGKFLSYYVSRELPLHVGPGKRFPDAADHARFNEALDLHCRQATVIVEKFAAGWYSKARFEHDLTPERAERFIAYSLTKVRNELRMRSE